MPHKQGSVQGYLLTGLPAFGYDSNDQVTDSTATGHQSKKLTCAIKL